MAKNQSKHFLAELEEKTVEKWQKNKTFQKSLDNRKSSKHFEFYDGPPFANGLPHYGHISSSIAKDAICRFKTMQGYHVPRRFGWDCHGLPAEMKAEADLDLGSKAAIEEYGIEKFVNYCRGSVTEFTKQWERYIHRLGRWVDFSDNYYTMDNDYMESVMWAFKELYDKGLVSEGFKVMPYCHVCETSLSHFETRQDESYRERVDLAVTVRFRLESGMTLLAWTTTPWTLVANLALAINKDLEYVVYEGNGEQIVLAKDADNRYEEELKDYKKLKTVKGKELLDLKYEPLFDYFKGHNKSHRVLHADFVSADDGTGIAHEAPGFGEEDQVLCEANGIEVVVPVDKHGNYTNEIYDLEGVNVFEANEQILEKLENNGMLFRKENYAHMYPHCWRTDNPLIYRAQSSWFIDVPRLKTELQKNNNEINWVPDNVRDGAFGQWLDGVRIWNVSRDRYWGAPLPVWKTDDGEVLVVGSLEEIKKRAVNPDKLDDLHKPYIDEVVLKTDSGKEAKRIPEVFDCWFESGAMPFAQHHYPFSKKQIEIPADYIVEYVGQVRGWFYTLHVLAAALFKKPAFKNVIAHGVVLGSDGRKMSKRLGNYPDVNEVLDRYGADAVRLYQFESPVMVGETIVTDEKAIQDVHRNVLMRLYNTYTFFKTYADVDGWKPPTKLNRPDAKNELDKWILARLDQLILESTEGAEKYNIPKAVRPIREFVDDLSNWYVRRSRRRFWKSENDDDKNQAYLTLYYVLIRTSQVMAPWAPFLPEFIYGNLHPKDKNESVHLTDWPTAKHFNEKAIEAMLETRKIITDALSQRADSGLKVRQPLAKLSVSVPIDLTDDHLTLIEEEVNVHEVAFTKSEVSQIVLDTHIDEELRLEGLMREIVRQIQASRKKAGLNVSDRIELNLESTSPLIIKSVEAHKAHIKSETLSTALNVKKSEEKKENFVEFDGQDLLISIKKAN